MTTFPNSPRVLKGGLDCPPPSHVASDWLEVRGWVYSAEAPIVAVQLFIDELFMGNLRATIIHNPKVQLAAQDRGIEWYLAHPNAAYQKLMDLSQNDPSVLGESLTHQALLAVAEGRDFATEHGFVEAAPSRDPLPATEAARGERWKQLIAKSVTPGEKLSEDEEATLDQE